MQIALTKPKTIFIKKALNYIRVQSNEIEDKVANENQRLSGLHS